MKESQARAAASQSPASNAADSTPEVLAGDSPPRPAWPLVVGVGVWVLWVGFLLAMMVVRMRTTAV